MGGGEEEEGMIPEEADSFARRSEEDTKETFVSKTDYP